VLILSPFRARDNSIRNHLPGALQNTWKKTDFAEKKKRGVNADRIVGYWFFMVMHTLYTTIP
jgi:hypothetical protein